MQTHAFGMTTLGQMVAHVIKNAASSAASEVVDSNEALSNAAALGKSAAKGAATDPDLHKSIISFTAATRFDPICLIDTRVLYNKEINEVVSTAFNLIASYIVQGFNVAFNLDRVIDVQKLAKLNNLVSGSKGVTFQSADAPYACGWSQWMGYEPNGDKGVGLSFQSADANAPALPCATVSANDFNEANNLIVGKTFTLSAGSSKDGAKVDIGISLLQVPQTPGYFKDFYFNKSNKADLNHTFSDRVIGLESGRLSYADFLTGKDITTAHRNNRIREKLELGNLSVGDRKLQSLIKSGNPLSLRQLSSVIILDSTTAKEIEIETSNHFSDFKDREAMFDSSLGAIFIIVDQERERCTFYLQSVPTPSVASFAALKRGNKKGSSTIVEDFMKSFLQGQSPTL